MNQRRILIYFGLILAAVLLALALLTPRSPAGPEVAEAQQLEAKCMAALNEWFTKKAPRTKFFGECEQHYLQKGNGVQASFFATARRESAGKY